jgi:hypothetical protein
MADVSDALRKVLNENYAGNLAAPDPTTCDGSLKGWFEEHTERNCTPKTVERIDNSPPISCRT